MKKKIILLIVFAGIMVVFNIFSAIYYLADSYPEFEKTGTSAFKIPGLETHFVPQGIDYHQSSNKFIISGYMNNGEPSRFYIVNKENGETEKYFTLKINGDPYAGHAGGVALDDNYAWVVGDKLVHRFSFLEALNVNNSGSLNVIDSFNPKNNADFVLTYNNKLIVGEYYKSFSYKTSKSHHIKTSFGDINHALSFVFPIDQSKECGIVSKMPESALSLPDKAQGLTITRNGKLALSTSYGIVEYSQINLFENVFNKSPQTTFAIQGTNIPVFVLAMKESIKSIKLPPMSEEIVNVNDKIYCLFESNSIKFRMLAREIVDSVYALQI